MKLVRALHRHRRGQGSNPGKPDFFFRLSFRNCIVALITARISFTFNSSYLFSKCDCATIIFFGNLIFALTNRTLSGKHLNCDWFSVCLFDT